MTISKIRQFQLIQASLQNIVLKCVVSKPLDEVEHRSAIQAIRKKLLYDFDVKISYVDDIPREPSGKYQDFKSELDEPASIRPETRP